MIMEFIKKNWNANHILVRDRNFFEWMYTDSQGCNFIIAVDEDENMLGMEGVIKYNNSDHPDIAGTLWKVVKTPNPRLGMEIGEKVYEVYQPKCSVAPGLNRKAVRINQILGFLTMPLNHYYILGQCDTYNIALVKETPQRLVENTNKKFVLLSSQDEVEEILDDDLQRQKTPYKDLNYIIHRYMEHPIYKYDLLGIHEADKPVRSILIGREVSYGNSYAYKIVDYLGYYEDLAGTASCFYNFIDERKYEYIDLYCYGIPDEILKTAGFCKRVADEIIIPNYFSPFERKNVDIYFSSSQNEGLNVFRGDGDQDRPS